MKKLATAFIVSGSHGTILVNATTGKPIQIIIPCDCGDMRSTAACEAGCVNGGSSYMDYTYDVIEWRTTYPGLKLEGDDLDILDIGFTDKDGMFEGPAQDWRDERAWRVLDGDPEAEDLNEDSPQAELNAALLKKFIRLQEQEGFLEKIAEYYTKSYPEIFVMATSTGHG